MVTLMFCSAISAELEFSHRSKHLTTSNCSTELANDDHFIEAEPEFSRRSKHLTASNCYTGLATDDQVMKTI